ARRPDAREVVIVAAAPDRIGVSQPERRRIRPRREIHVQVRLLGPQLANQMNRRVEIAVERTPERGARCIAGAVDLELIDTVPANHVDARVPESLIVDGSGKREAVGVGLESLLLAVGKSLLAWRPVPA